MLPAPAPARQRRLPFHKNQGLFSAAGVFGEENEGIGAVGADFQRIFRKLDFALFVPRLVRMEQDVVSFGKRFVLLARRQVPDQLPHGLLNNPAVGEFMSILGQGPGPTPWAISVGLSLFLRHSPAPIATRNWAILVRPSADSPLRSQIAASRATPRFQAR